MGVVYRARQISLNRLVALKMLRDAALASADELRRFQNEAEAVARLDHPHIVPVYEVGEHDGRRYFSMKLISGPSLQEALSTFAASPRSAAALMVTIAEAVHHAHQRGILHRDLKPSNILLDDRGQPHVTDFGLARRVEGGEDMTLSGAVIGTPAYMAPEQAVGMRRLVTTLSDVYGLGAVLYALLTDVAPFAGDTALETLDRVRREPPVPPSRVNPNVPRDMEVICLKCLEKDPARRYVSEAALAEDLARYLAGEPIMARPVTRSERAVKWVRRRPAIAALLGSVTLVTALGLGGVLWQWHQAVLARRRREGIGSRQGPDGTGRATPPGVPHIPGQGKGTDSTGRATPLRRPNESRPAVLGGLQRNPPPAAARRAAPRQPRRHRSPGFRVVLLATKSRLGAYHPPDGCQR